MSGRTLFLDTNIVLYFLNGDVTLIPVLEENQLYVSFITQLELLSFHGITAENANSVKSFLNECVIIDITSQIKEHTIALRKKHRLKLPDAIVAATSLYLNIPLLTADKDLKKVSELNLIFYQQ